MSEINSFLKYCDPRAVQNGQWNKRALLARCSFWGGFARGTAKSLGLSQPTAGKLSMKCWR